MKQYLATHRKAIAGAIATGIGAGIAAAVAGGSWQTVVISIVVGALGGHVVVARSPANKPADPPKA